MRWLFLKDLQILRRSPLVTALLVVYPMAIAVLIGFALSRGPEKPRVAFVNEVPQGQPLRPRRHAVRHRGRTQRALLANRLHPVSSEQQARDMVESGDVLAALILPPDLIDKLESLGSLNRPRSRPCGSWSTRRTRSRRGLVDDRISSLVTQANLRISKQVTRISANYLALLLRGGNFNLLGQTLQRPRPQEHPAHPRGAAAAAAEADSPSAAALDRVIRFSRLARQNLNLANPAAELDRPPDRGPKGGRLGLAARASTRSRSRSPRR